MGVPSFYRWLITKYPNTIVKAIEEFPQEAAGIEVPVDASEPNPNEYEFDNLYLDMNGIIHPCTHPEGEEAPPTEKEMYKAIFRYLDRLFNLIRPRKLVYMAIDGVAPRAKMNQQRSRRFRAAQEAEEAQEAEVKLREEYRQNGFKVPPKKPPAWDSNVITPGTPFMAKLAEWLRYYIMIRQNTVPAWKNVKVILSDAQSPGEGEHKIMQYIRRQRAEPGYDPNTKHCLYGLDADLIMLGLATHEIHFSILREQVLFGKQKKQQEMAMVDPVLMKEGGVMKYKAPPKPFEILRIWILREYLQQEFRPDAFYQQLPFTYDFERCVDDFIFLCFFVGNDFLPHLPSLSIRDGGLDLLLDLYKRTIPSCGGYLTKDGDVNLSRVDVIMGVLGGVEDEIFRRKRGNEMRMKRDRENRKRSRRDGGRLDAKHIRDLATPLIKKKRGEIPSQPASNSANQSAADALRKSLGAKTSSEGDKPTDEKPKEPETKEDEGATGDDAVDDSKEVKEQFKGKLKELENKRNIHDDVPDHVRLGENGWRERYYINKFGEEEGKDPNLKRRVVESYVIGLCWVMQYYYKGCQSWKWFFEFHYAPFASDMVNIDQIKVEFPNSRPFTPIEQLMGVLPARSAHALPVPCHQLMCDPESPIADFYPKHFQYDPNGKPMRWLWIALLPFIDETRLKDEVAKIEEKFTEEEKSRNRLSPDFLFVHRESKGAEAVLKSVANSKYEEYDIKDFEALENTPATSGDARNTSNLPPLTDYQSGGGITGYFVKPPPNVELDSEKPMEFPPELDAPKITHNNTVICDFRLPPMRPHLTRLLENVTIPKPTVENVRVKPVRMGKLFIGNMLAERENRSDPSRSGVERNWQSTQRSWGSMEPRDVRKSNRGRNPFLNNNRGGYGGRSQQRGGYGGHQQGYHQQQYGGYQQQQQYGYGGYNYPPAPPPQNNYPPAPNYGYNGGGGPPPPQGGYGYPPPPPAGYPPYGQNGGYPPPPPNHPPPSRDDLLKQLSNELNKK